MILDKEQLIWCLVEPLAVCTYCDPLGDPAVLLAVDLQPFRQLLHQVPQAELNFFLEY